MDMIPRVLRCPCCWPFTGVTATTDSSRARRPTLSRCATAGTLPKMVVATPDAERSFYMDRKDGSQKWETVILFSLVDHLRHEYKISQDRSGLFLYGISMGGMGALRMGFKHPERVGAVVALSPASTRPSSGPTSSRAIASGDPTS